MTSECRQPLRAVAYGGGVQSTALLVLAAQRRIDFPIFLFANVGHDSEHPATLDYFQRYAKPYAEAHGIRLVELQRQRRDGSIETLYGRLTRPGSRSLPIPVRMSNGAPGTRSCTSACWFCPLRRPSAFAEMRRDQPDLFARACDLEELLNARRRELGKDPVWLTRFNRPLDEAVARAQDTLPGMTFDGTDDGICDNGTCFT